ncbi:hypothetical protein Hanom_Chr09g00831891 [Helianthus anomalus]
MTYVLKPKGGTDAVNASQYLGVELGGRFLIEVWQGHGPGKFSGRSAKFSHFDRKFSYILCLARACPGFFLVHVSFGPGTFNWQDPPLCIASVPDEYWMLSLNIQVLVISCKLLILQLPLQPARN